SRRRRCGCGCRLASAFARLSRPRKRSAEIVGQGEQGGYRDMGSAQLPPPREQQGYGLRRLSRGAVPQRLTGRVGREMAPASVNLFFGADAQPSFGALGGRAEAQDNETADGAAKQAARSWDVDAGDVPVRSAFWME